ncbi:hypothetical protein HHI36_016321 [Cryptolaemus montrouzieri]|uniref:Uncharacterized protein n=1 Tax=Cryptolaemus montrouzieri TaxID=559131 RepID=A0ABD2NJD1_9CUCU
MYCGIMLKLIAASFLTIVFAEELCEYIHFPRRNISMNCCANNSFSESSFREYHELKKVEAVYLSVNGSLYICETYSGSNVNSRSAVKDSDDSGAFPVTFRDKAAIPIIPLFANRRLADVPARCPNGKVKDSDDSCGALWD